MLRTASRAGVHRGLRSMGKVRAVVLALMGCSLGGLMAQAQVFQGGAQSAQQPADPQGPPEDVDTSAQSVPVQAIFPHPETDRIWISGQANIISQWHPDFHSPYEGAHSLPSHAQDATSRVLTLYTGLRLTGTTEVLCDVQETGGHGIGEALGLAGATNLDVVRNPSLSKAPYIGRAVLSHTFAFSSEMVKVARTPIALQTDKPVRRLEVHVGKFT